jgi:20S proteasome alpha/beta subunit
MAGIKISTEIISQTPELAHLYDVVHFLENAPAGSLFPKKKEASAISTAEEAAYELVEAHPNMSLKEAITTVLNSCEEGLSGEVLLKITEKVIKKWAQLSKPIVPQLESELQLA